MEVSNESFGFGLAGIAGLALSGAAYVFVLQQTNSQSFAAVVALIVMGVGLAFAATTQKHSDYKPNLAGSDKRAMNLDY